jgi:DNA-directed RNA polymerase specialized sigma24 family protein
VYTIVKATLIQLARSASRRKRREETADLKASPAPDPDSAIDVRNLLSRLDKACQELLRRAFLDGASYADLSAELGLAESSIRAKVSRCIRKARTFAV